MSTVTDRAAPVEVADGYRAGRTLPIRVELVRQLKRRRTLVMFGILIALPFVLLIAFQLGGGPGSDNTRVNLMDTATVSGANFAAVNLFASAGFLLVVPVALFCGDTVASEASWSSLRYLLAAPVPRARLLWSKLVVGLVLSLAAMLLLPLTSSSPNSSPQPWRSGSPPAPTPPSARSAGRSG
jgi:ABC-2 type transport system permease protein